MKKQKCPTGNCRSHEAFCLLKFCFRTGRGCFQRTLFFTPVLGKWFDFSLQFVGCKLPPKVFGIMWRFFGSWSVVLIENFVIEEMHLGRDPESLIWIYSLRRCVFLSIPSCCFYLSHVLCAISIPSVEFAQHYRITLLRWLVCHCSPNQEREKKKCFPSWKKGLNSLLGLAVCKVFFGEAANVMWNLHCQGITWQFILIVTPPSHYLCWHSQSVAL